MSDLDPQSILSIRPIPPKTSWWCEPHDRAEFDARAREEYEHRMKVVPAPEANTRRGFDFD